MPKPLLFTFRIILYMLLSVILYFTGILVVNTATDYKPTDTDLSLPSVSFSSPDTAKKVYSVISWNIGYGGLGKEADFFYDGGRMVRPAKEEAIKYFNGILQTIKSFDRPDIIMLQEVDRASCRSYSRDQYHEICVELPDMQPVFAKNYDVLFVPLPPFDPMGKVESGLAVFSRQVMSSARLMAFPGNYSWPKKLFMPDRCFIIASIDLPSGRRLHLINTHNSAFDNGSLRDRQLSTLFARMEELYLNGDYVLAGGDWNINPPGFTGNNFASGDSAFRVIFNAEIFNKYPDWQVVFDDNFPSNRDVKTAYSHGKTPTTILDFFICSSNIKILNINTLYDGFEHTDHQPVKLIFSLD